MPENAHGDKVTSTIVRVLVGGAGPNAQCVQDSVNKLTPHPIRHPNERSINRRGLTVMSTNWGVSAGARPPGVLVEGHMQAGALQVAGSHEYAAAAVQVRRRVGASVRG